MARPGHMAESQGNGLGGNIWLLMTVSNTNMDTLMDTTSGHQSGMKPETGK